MLEGNYNKVVFSLQIFVPALCPLSGIMQHPLQDHLTNPPSPSPSGGETGGKRGLRGSEEPRRRAEIGSSVAQTLHMRRSPYPFPPPPSRPHPPCRQFLPRLGLADSPRTPALVHQPQLAVGGSSWTFRGSVPRWGVFLLSRLCA